jgi:4-hydroxy-2-oxovalerate aldolase
MQGIDMQSIQILECTLRDGSYTIDWQFTAEDTALIVAALERAGLQLIEIGHGLGMNASQMGRGFAAASDEEYLQAAADACSQAQFGMFFIPGIADCSHLDMGVDYGMGFVRVGTNVTEVAEARTYIEYAKKLGLTVSSNLMKSYALPIGDFVEQAKLLVDYGTDVICIVDSAGGMMPKEVHDYTAGLKDAVDVPVGFHGHNNLQLAVANSMAAIEAGAEIIDATLQGIGRSAGNTPMELLVGIMEKLGYKTGIDLYRLMDIGQSLVRPLMTMAQGIDPIETTTGLAQFHSGFLEKVKNAAREHQLDARDLIFAVSREDRIDLSDEVLAKSVDRLSQLDTVGQNANDWMIPDKMRINNYSAMQIQDLSHELKALSKKTHKPSVFVVAKSRNSKLINPIFPYIRQTHQYVIGNIEFLDIEDALLAIEAIDGIADIIFIDIDQLPDDVRTLSAAVKKSNVSIYSDGRALVQGTEAFLSQFMINLQNKKIVVWGNCALASELGQGLERYGAQITVCIVDAAEKPDVEEDVVSLVLLYEDALRECDIFIGLAPYTESLDGSILEKLSQDVMVLDAGLSSFTTDFIQLATARKMSVYRIDIRAGLSGEITNRLDTVDLIELVIGRGEIDGVSVVAGGLIGEMGEIVVDRITDPTKVIGVADGMGGVLDSGNVNDVKNITRVKTEILRRLVVHDGKKYLEG